MPLTILPEVSHYLNICFFFRSKLHFRLHVLVYCKHRRTCRYMHDISKLRLKISLTWGRCLRYTQH